MFIQTIDLQILWDCLDKGEIFFFGHSEFLFCTINGSINRFLFMALKKCNIFSITKTLFSKIETQVKRISNELWLNKIPWQKKCLDWLNNDTTKCLDIHEKKIKILDIIQMALEEKMLLLTYILRELQIY